MSRAIGKSAACAGARYPATERDEDNPQNLNASEPISILDMLNTDCWRAVLDWLDVDDVVRSERVSRGWQRVVQEYLQGVHSYYIDSCIDHAYTTRVKNLYKTYNEKYYEYHTLKSKVCLFEEMFKKMGPYIVTLLADKFSHRWLNVMIENCPNLEDVTFFRVEDHLPLGGLVNCKRLKRVTFESCPSLREYYLQRFIIHETLEELVINNTCHVNGYFLGYLKSTNLKKLALNNNNCLNFEHLVSAASFLTELTALELNENSSDLFENVHLLLDKTPKLEHLSINKFEETGTGYSPRAGDCSIVSTELVESIGRLSCLRHLSMGGSATDALLKAVARGCKELRTLSIEECREVSGPALVSLCRELPALTELNVAKNIHLSNEHLAACITSYPSLTTLDVTGCDQVTLVLVAACARDVRRRPRPLRLRLGDTAVTKGSAQALFAEEKSMGLALSWRETSNKIPFYEDSESDSDRDYDYYHNDSDENRDWDDEVEQYLESRDADY